jgi:hypothetical protein
VTDSSATATAPPCYDIYSETHLAGPYWLVRRNSCSAQVYECPDGYSPPAPPCQEVRLIEARPTTTSASAVGCYYIYQETHVGPITYIRRSSCDPGMVYFCNHQNHQNAVQAVQDGPDLSCA